MSFSSLRINISAGFSAISKATKERKLVRQIDTKIRHYERMNPNTQALYDELVKTSGHYSINPLKKIFSYYKVWNKHRKNIVKLNKISEN